MTIEAVVPPTRSSVWTAQDAKQAFDLLTGDPPQAARYGVYRDDPDKPEGNGEGKARSQGMALDRLIKANHGRRFGVSVWKDQDGNYVGALLPREPVARKPVPPKGNKRS